MALPSAQIKELKIFIQALQQNPQLYHTPELSFLKEYIESIGGRIPMKTSPTTEAPPPKNEEPPKSKPEPKDDSDSEDISDYVEEEMDASVISNEGVIGPEEDPLPEQFEFSGQEISEEDLESAEKHRSNAMSEMSEGKFAEAVEAFTSAIKCNPDSAMLYAKRANALMKLKRVKAVIADCDQAIKRNPDSALAHKLRGRAYRLLGEWKSAAVDLRKACNLDCDEQAIEWLNEVTPNANKIEEHQRGQQRKREEVEVEQRKQRVRRARKEHQKAAQREREQEANNPFGAGGAPFGAGGSPFGGADPGVDLGGLFSDPELMAGLQDPELREAFMGMNMGGKNMGDYKDNPKVRAFLEKLTKKFGGGDGPSPFDEPETTPEPPTAEQPKPANPPKPSTLEEVD